MKSLEGVERPQDHCSCQLCNTLRAHGHDSAEFTLPEPEAKRVQAEFIDDLKAQLRGMGL